MTEEKNIKKEQPQKKEVVKKEEPKEKTFVMKVTHLAWGRDNLNHFYADKKPLISEKVMGKYAGILQVWLKSGWVEEGKY